MKARILMAATCYPGRPGDISGIFLAGLARELGIAHDVTVLAPDAPGALPSLSGVPVHRFTYMIPRRYQTLAYGAGIPDNLRLYHRRAALIPPFLLSMYGALRRSVRDYHWIISHWLIPTGLLAAFAIRHHRPSIRHIAVAHGSDVNLLRRLPCRRRMTRIILRSCDAVVTTAAWMKPVLMSVGGFSSSSPEAERIVTIPMGFDPPSEMPDAPRSPDPSGVSPAVLFIGRLVPVKGADVLVRAVALLQHRGRLVKLHVAGDGPERAYLDRLARALNVRAVFHGRVSPWHRDRLFEMCDVAVFPSRAEAGGRCEGLPVALLEAMGGGLPVIASVSGGISDVVESGRSGLLVPPEDPEALAGAMERLLSDTDLRRRLCKRAREVASRFTWHEIGRRYLELLHRSAGSPAARTRDMSLSA